jgi:hypothetical protein
MVPSDVRSDDEHVAAAVRWWRGGDQELLKLLLERCGVNAVEDELTAHAEKYPSATYPAPAFDGPKAN